MNNVNARCRRSDIPRISVDPYRGTVGIDSCGGVSGDVLICGDGSRFLLFDDTVQEADEISLADTSRDEADLYMMRRDVCAQLYVRSSAR